MSKELAKQKIQKLIDRYEALSPQEKLMNEEMTKTKFIRPLFEALGWDFEEDVLLEDNISRGRVDYSFRLNGRTKFFLEAKPLKADIDNLEYAKQATNYAWLKNVNWAVLSDFEGIRVFYPAERGQAKSCKHFNYHEYVTKFDELWILSKESFQSDLLDKRAVEWGAKPEEIKVSKQLAEDMNTWRNNLCHKLRIWNEKLTEDELDEGIQKILDRFIFMRSCEDRGLEDNTLQSQFRIWRKEGHKEKFLIYLKPLIEEYRKTYNSGLFDEHPCENFNSDTGDFDEIISGLYHSKNGQDYNFKDIDADALGSVYEQYLGHLLQKASKADKDDSKKKRKSQGIYYTPTFIVDYIVENTVGKALKEKSQQEIEHLKILDPACGSGSFLIKAFDYLANYQTKKENTRRFALKSKLGRIEQAFKNRDGENELPTTKKIDILRNNIYGVDLDQQAVEIAQLNLMLKALDQKQKLPHLSNVKCGNSLIDDPKIAGNSAFKWEIEFSDINNQGGFDVIIGNPPYINLANIENSNTRQYLTQRFETAKNKSDLYGFFVERSLKLLKNGGILGFIISNSWLGTDSFSEFRKYLLKYTTILEITKLPQVFPGTNVTPVLLFLEKTLPKTDYKIKISQYNQKGFSLFDHQLSLTGLTSSPNSSFSFTPKVQLETKTVALGRVAKLSLGIKTSDDSKFILNSPKESSSYKLLRGKDVFRYHYEFNNKWIWYEPSLMMLKKGAGPRKLEYFSAKKILFRTITGGKIVAALDKQGYLTNDKVHVLYDSGELPLEYILGIVDSKLMNYWIKSTFGDLLELKINQIERIPIAVSDNKVLASELIKLVKANLSLYEVLKISEKGTNHYEDTNDKIMRTERAIDQAVYSLYCITPSSIKIIEESGK